MLCLLTFEISEDWDGKNFYVGVHGILVLLKVKIGHIFDCIENPIYLKIGPNFK